MLGKVLLLVALLGNPGPELTEYARVLGAKQLDQAALDAEGYGKKESIKREGDGLRITLGPGEQETGWRTPPQLRFGGDFSVAATFVIKKLPKPAQEDGAAIGLAITFGDINQPDVTLVRVVEPKGPEVYRSIDKAPADPNAMQGQMPMMMGRGVRMMGQGQPGGKPAKPPRHTFPAAGDIVKMQIEREGTTIRFEVADATSPEPRYLGQVTLGPNDVSAVKLFASNRNGAEAVNVLLRDLTIHAGHINGLGTMVRTVFDDVFYADPTSIENGLLVVGGQPKTPPAAAPKPGESKKPGSAATPVATPPAATAPGAAAPAPAAAAPAPPPVAGAAPAVLVAPGQMVVVAAAPGPINPASATPTPTPTPPAGPAGPNQQKPAQPPKPKAKIPFDELDSIRFERSPALSARFIGQPNLDFTMPGSSAKKDDATAQPDAKKDGATAATAQTKKDSAPAAKAGDKPADKTKEGGAGKADAKKADTKKAGVAAAKADTKKADTTKGREATAKADAKKDDTKKEGTKTAKADDKKADTKKDGAAAGAQAKKTEGAPKAASKKAATPKGREKKTDQDDDALAPPPGTTITKIPKVEPKKNGIRDLQLSLFGLRKAKIKQVMVNCQTDKGPASWRLDTSDSQDWPLVVRRSGTELAADLFLEPPPGDCHEKDFTINITYEDGQPANTTAKADKHTDPKLAVDPKAAGAPLLDAWVHLTGDETLFGKLESIGPETLRLTTPWQDHLELPLARVVGIRVGLPEPKEPDDSFAKRLKARGSEDLLLAQTKKGEVIAISGVLERTDNDRLIFRYQGRARTLPLAQVEGVILAGRSEARPAEEFRPTFALASGIALSGRWKDLDSSVWKIQTGWGQDVSLPAGDIQSVRFRGGKMTYLSDLNPSKVEEAPFFGHRLSWRRDVNLVGEPLKIKGRTYDHGLAVHSRCGLTYDLNGRYSRFEVLVGFDDAAKSKGRVDCRVIADGKELYANHDLKADAPPVHLALPVEGVEQLRLSVDFGRDQDTGDRVIWANPRLFRGTASTSKTQAIAADTTKGAAGPGR
jgi:hypothetical protein